MRTRSGILVAVLVAACLGAPPARAVQVGVGSVAGLAGQTFDIPLTVSNTTGLAIRSVQFDVTYNGSLVSAIDVLESGTLAGTAGWSDASFDIDIVSGATRRLRVATAGANAISGAGTLLLLRFTISPAQLTASGTALTLGPLEFNEGTPNDTTSNGFITINATPIITVSPNTGTIVRGSTLAFNVSGSVSPPVSWATTDPSVATISGTGVLTGVSPGSVQVVAVDNAGRRDTTDSEILVRGMSITAGPASVFVANPVSIPVTVSSLTGLGIRAGQFTLTYPANRFEVVGVSTPPGTLLSGYGPVGFSSDLGTCTVDFAGTSDLSGAGVLCYLDIVAGSTAGAMTLVFTQALFNEVMPALTINNTLTITGLPTIGISPDQVTLLAGQTRQFTVSGAATAPLTWSVLDPAIGSISPSGLFTAVKGGTTRISVVDAVGANDLNTAVNVFDFRAALDTVTAPPGATVQIAIDCDRALDPLDVFATQIAVTFPTTHLTSIANPGSGSMAAWVPGVLTHLPSAGRVEVTAAGATELTGSGPMHSLMFTISAAAPPGIDIPLTFASLLCNEGDPLPQLGNGLIRVRTTVDVPGSGAMGLALAPARPNPMRGSTRLEFTLPSGPAPVRLAVFGADGRLVRTLLDAAQPAGRGAVVWEGDDDRGSRVPAGLYFARLDVAGRSISRRLAVIR